MADIHGITSLIPLIPCRTSTTTQTGTGVDITDFDGGIKFILDAAAGTGTTPTNDVKIQDSADNSAWADVSGLTFTQLTTSASLQSIGFPANSLRKYIRAVATIAGTTPSYTFSVNAVGSKQVI